MFLLWHEQLLIEHYLSLVNKVVVSCLVKWATPTNDIDSLQLELACVTLKTSYTYPAG